MIRGLVVHVVYNLTQGGHKEERDVEQFETPKMYLMQVRQKESKILLNEIMEIDSRLESVVKEQR